MIYTLIVLTAIGCLSGGYIIGFVFGQRSMGEV